MKSTQDHAGSLHGESIAYALEASADYARVPRVGCRGMAARVAKPATLTATTASRIAIVVVIATSRLGTAATLLPAPTCRFSMTLGVAKPAALAPAAAARGSWTDAAPGSRAR